MQKEMNPPDPHEKAAEAQKAFMNRAERDADIQGWIGEKRRAHMEAYSIIWHEVIVPLDARITELETACKNAIDRILELDKLSMSGSYYSLNLLRKALNRGEP